MTQDSQGDFLYHDKATRALERSISTERLNTYLAAAGYDKTKALKLYIWNAQASQAFYFPLQAAEVTLRNAVNEALSSAFGTDWHTNLVFLGLIGQDSTAKIEQAISRIKRQSKSPTVDRIVAALSFDFWARLLTSDFDRPIWQTRLRSVFPNLPAGSSRGELRTLCVQIRDFRNRVAHYEPVLREDLSKIHTSTLRLIGFRCHDTALWVRHQSTVQTVIRARPK